MPFLRSPSGFVQLKLNWTLLTNEASDKEIPSSQKIVTFHLHDIWLYQFSDVYKVQCTQILLFLLPCCWKPYNGLKKMTRHASRILLVFDQQI